MTASWCALLLLAAPSVQKPSDWSLQSSEEREMERKVWEELSKNDLADGGHVMPPPFKWHLQNVIENIEMPGMQESGGIPVKLHAVRVKNNLRGVLEELVNDFVKQGLYMQPFDQQAQFTAETAVTGLDTERFISYTAIIRPENGGFCTVVLGEANIGLAAVNKQLYKGRNEFAPVPELARHRLTSRAEGMQSLTFLVAMPEVQLRAWYSAEMKKRGYEERDSVFKKGREHISLRTRMDGVDTAALLIRREITPDDL
jgi:hypothetical protein